jgi:hypothetical protein
MLSSAKIRFRELAPYARIAGPKDGLGGKVADTRLLKLLSSLEVQFDAAVAREEDEAASDLALSLRQGLVLRDVMRRGPWVARFDGFARPVSLVGRDFVACDGPDAILVPQRRLVVAPSDSGDAARFSPASLVETLRAVCRSGADVEITCGEAAINGRLIQVGPDHAAVLSASGPTFIALEAVDRVRLFGSHAREAGSRGL